MADLENESKKTTETKKGAIKEWSKVTLSNSFMFRLVMEDKDALGKRTRYYQSLMDAEELHKGVEIRALPRSIVLFICKYDPFDLKLLKYSFRNICLENNEAELNDQSLKVIINTRGKTEGYSQKVVNFIEYINNETVTDDFTKRLNDRVKRWRLDNEKARAYMTHEQELIEAKAEGRAEGEAKKAEAIAEKLLRKGNDVKTVLELTELSLEKIKEIADKIGVELVK